MAFTGLRRVVGVFRHRDYATYTAGNSLSLIGLWMQRIGVGWLAWELTHSPTWLGVIAMTEFFPVVFLGPLGGVLADRFDRATNMILFQSIAMTASALLFVLAFGGWINIWLVALLTLIVGIASGLNSASRLALAPSLVPKDDLTTAIAMNAMVFNTARFIGPAIAGVVINIWGVEYTFAGNAFSYLTLIAALWTIRAKLAGPARAKSPGTTVLSEMKDGVQIVLTNPGTRTIMLVMISTAVLLRPILQLLPGISDELYQAGVDGFTHLMVTIGLGAIVGGYWMAQRGNQDNYHLGLIGVLVSLIGNMGLVLVNHIEIALPFAFLMGGGVVMTGIGVQSTIQMAVPENFRGRVLGLFGICFMGGPALGALGMGALAEIFGLTSPILVGATGIFILWLYIWPKRHETIGFLKQL